MTESMLASDFERDLDSTTTRASRAKGFPEEANYWYNYASAEALIENPADLQDMIKDFLAVQVPRLRVLASYSNARNDGIETRAGRTDANKSDYRAKHNFGGYIATIQTGYLFGIPVKVESGAEGDEATLEQEAVDLFNDLNEIDDLNAQLGEDCSRYGRAFELHYRNADDEDRVALSSVFDTFCVYDPTVRHNKIAAVRLLRTRSATGTRITVQVYTSTEVVTYRETSADNPNLEVAVDGRVPHSYGRVPVVEWSNTRHRMGDYEPVLTLIDLYDAGQSDTANYMNDLNDALLVIKGDIDLNDYNGGTLRNMRDANLLLLKYPINALDGRSTPIDAGYLYKQYDVAGTEAYKARTQADIHKFSFTPDLTDENFAANASGVAMKYKLTGMEQLRSMKERSFTRAIRERYAIIDGLHAAVNEKRINAKALRVEFTENLPADYWANIKSYLEAGGEISVRTLMSFLPEIGSYQDEMARLKDERVGDSVLDYDLDGHGGE